MSWLNSFCINYRFVRVTCAVFYLMSDSRHVLLGKITLIPFSCFVKVKYLFLNSLDYKYYTLKYFGAYVANSLQWMEIYNRTLAHQVSIQGVIPQSSWDIWFYGGPTLKLVQCLMFTGPLLRACWRWRWLAAKYLQVKMPSSGCAGIIKPHFDPLWVVLHCQRIVQYY